MKVEINSFIFLAKTSLLFHLQANILFRLTSSKKLMQGIKRQTVLICYFLSENQELIELGMFARIWVIKSDLFFDQL